MMRIRTDWGALVLTHDGGVIVCMHCGETPRCLCFNSLKELKHAIGSKKIYVKKWVVSVPRSSCILKPLALPASDLAEAVKMTEFELPSLVPLPPDEVVYGCTVLNRQDDTLNVMVCILKLNTLDEHLEPLRAIGIEPRRVTLESLAIQNWFNAIDSAATGPLTSALVDGGRCTVLTCVDGNFQKAYELVSSDAHAEMFLREIAEKVLNQHKELLGSSRKISTIMIAGAGECVPEIKELFSSIPSASAVINEPVIVPTPSIVHFESSEQDDNDANCAYEAVVATGLLDLAKSSALPFSNLIPHKRLRKFQRRTAVLNYVFTGSVFVLLILFLWLCLWGMNRRIQRKTRRIDEQITPIKTVASSVASKRQRVRAIQNQLAGRGLITQVFQELYKYTPKNVSISELRFATRRNSASVDIKGQADLLSSAFEYTDAMSEATLLREMQVFDAQQIPRPGGSVVEFKARCAIQDD
jgi:hypothetical protein